MVHGVYRHSCINCGGETSDIRLHLRLPCEKCLPIHHEDILNNFKGKTLTLSDLYNLVIKTSGREGKLKELYILERKVNEVIELFRRILGSEPWSAQKTWIRRVLKGKSFTIVAPTGTGKTVFGIIMSLYISSKGGKAYIVLPTTPLVLQVYEKTLQFAEKAGLHKLKILAYHAKLKKKEKDEVLSSVVKGDFNILITTSRFLTAHYDKVKNLNFTFIFVDDVDAILKSSKNIDRILTLLGFTEDDINIAYNLVKLKRQLTRFKSDEDKFKKLVEEINSLQEELSKRIGKVKSVLVVSTATGRPRGLRVKLFRELLGFEIGFRSELLRNIVDTYYLPKGESIEEVTYKLLKTLGKGGLVFVPVDKGLDYAKKLADYLNSRGLSVRVFSSKDIRALREFIEGKVDALIGVATYYGVMVRGLDLPERVRYAIFTGIPRFKFSTRFEEPHPYNIIRALTILREVLDEDDRKQVELLINRLNRLLQILPQTKINEITEKLKSGEPISEGPEALFSKALNLIKDRLSRRDIRERLSKLEDIIIRDENGKTYIYIPDIMTYLQASGRTSRMYAGGITKGLSVVIVDEEKLLK
ncbi:MAG TPA: reverse gyrase, partial [Desulfurococcales archaeon]|nr:reverse gyrase [Desulfurococcales archaeon]